MTKHKFVHDNTPRYTLFNLDRIHVGFDLFEGEIYWQGVANYGLWVLTALLVLLVMLALRALYIKAICVYTPARTTRRKIKSLVTSIPVICIKLVLLGLVALLMGYGSWNKFNDRLENSPLHNSACSVYQQLAPLQMKLKSLLKQGEISNQAATDVATRLNKPELVEKIPDYYEALAGNLTDMLPEPLLNATRPLRKICSPEKLSRRIYVKRLLEGIIGIVILSLWTIVLCVLIFKSFTFRSTLIMTLLCILALFTVIMWGVVASIVFMGYLAVADFCYNPVKPSMIYLKELNAEISWEIMAFYLDCKDENPLREDFGPLKNVLEDISRQSQPLAKIFESGSLQRHGKYAKELNDEVMYALELSTEIVNSKCPDSKKDFQALVNIPCRYVYWSLATLFVVAMFLTLLLSVFIMIAMKIRKYVHKFLPPKPPPPPSDTCPHTCPGPDDPMDRPLYHLPPKIPPPADMECPPSCKAFPRILRKLTQGLDKEREKRAETYACDEKCDKIYLDENGRVVPSECIIVSHKAVETEDAYMCTKSVLKAEMERAGKRQKKSKISKLRETKACKSEAVKEENPSPAVVGDNKDEVECVPDCDKSKDGKCGFFNKGRNDNTRNARLGNECKDCQCALRKNRSRKTKCY